ncbi:hypothetical protein KGM_209839 [Danaus plexippus plexippus]|uniref:Uncharacterized protein n=1 Tax=Danaus plexippus plexippus TaxID=278856 RepID=A0A212EJU5_DANPL|nr:hypothetical protein KGM_209839 [Danaus plexippus plexippus]
MRSSMNEREIAGRSRTPIRLPPLCNCNPICLSQMLFF